MRNRRSRLAVLWGRSNMSPALQQGLALDISKDCFVAAHGVGGQTIDYWVSGIDPSFTRTANYTEMINRLNGAQCDEVIIVCAHGEGSAIDEPADEYRAKLLALFGWIMEDTGATSRKVVLSKPWRADYPVDGYSNGGNGDQIRAIMDALATAEPGDTITVETSDMPRSGDNVHMDASVVYSTNPLTDTLTKRLLGALNSIL